MSEELRNDNKEMEINIAENAAQIMLIYTDLVKEKKIKKAIFTNGINKPASSLPAPPADLNELCNKK